MNDKKPGGYHSFLARTAFLAFRQYFRYFPLERGKTFVRRNVHPRMKKRILLCHYRGLSLHPMDFSLPRFNMMFYRDICEQEEEFLGKVLQAGMLFIDIGANIGSYSLPASALVGSSGKVISFEPASDNLSILRETVKLNHASNITVEQIALSDTVGEGRLRLHDGANTGKHALAAEGQDGEMETVELSTLDAYLERNNIQACDLIKLDVEGVELKVLKGGTKTLTSGKPPVLIVEVSDENATRYNSTSGELFAFLENLGYLRYKYLDGKLVKIDAVDKWVGCENYIFLPARSVEASLLPRGIQAMMK